jgi:hypothetical protein
MTADGTDATVRGSEGFRTAASRALQASIGKACIDRLLENPGAKIPSRIGESNEARRQRDRSSLRRSSEFNPG